jgi:hypothetical protein
MNQGVVIITFITNNASGLGMYTTGQVIARSRNHGLIETGVAKTGTQRATADL